jgi:hypothetical protein
MPDRTTIGELGCAGIDLEQWKADNRVPLFPGKMNHWVLVRTLRDNPTETDLRNTLYAVMNKWFKGTPVDPVLDTQEGGRAGATDNIRVIKTSPTPILLPNPARRREQLPGPMPTLNAEGGFVYVAFEFAYRGVPRDLPWPVRTAPGVMGVQLTSSAECIYNADWMLSEAGEPGPDAPPEKSATDIIGEKMTNILATTLRAGVTMPLTAIVKGLWPILLAGGIVGYLVLRSKTSTSQAR